MAGVLITFEGIEGCGKTTQMELLSASLRHRGLDPLSTREPGGTRLGDRVRQILLDPDQGPILPMTELLIYLGIRLQHIREVVGPALKSGRLVLCDRFSDATVAYQGYGRGLPLEKINTLQRSAGIEIRPDLTILLDLEVQAGLERTRSRREGTASRYDREEEAFHRRVREGYLEIARGEPGRVRKVDGSGVVDEVHRRIGEIVDRFLEERKAS